MQTRIAILMMCLAFAALLVSECAAQQARPLLIPWPKKITMGKGAVSFNAKLLIAVTGNNLGAARRVAQTFAADLSELGFAATVSKDSEAAGADITLRLALDKSLGREGYRMSIDRGMTVSANAELGLFWGTRTALQLLRKGPGVSVPKLSVFDKPEYGYRGLMVDVARQFHSIEFHRKMVKKLASYKMNIYHVHFADDQSYTLPSKAFPALPTPDRHYTKEQLKDLAALAARYHIIIMPEIDVPGHATALSAAIPEMVCRGKKPSGVICVGSEKSRAAVEALVTEAMDLFPGPYFHIGSDEVDYPVWNGCPDCEAAKTQRGLKDNEALYNDFINGMNRFIKSKGRKTIIWEGFKVGSTPTIDKDILIDQWANSYAMPIDVVKAGYDLVNCSWVPLYICRTSATAPETIAEWSAIHFGDPHPPKELEDVLTIQPTKQLKGICMCSWENSEQVQDAILWGIGQSAEGYATPAIRLPIVAERAWTGVTPADDVLSRVSRDMKGE